MLMLIAYNLYVDHVLDGLNPSSARHHGYLLYGLFGLIAIIRLVELALSLFKGPNPTFQRTASPPLN